MGNLTFRRKKVVAEELEELQKQIKSLEEQTRRSIDSKQSLQWFSSISLLFITAFSVALSLINVQDKSRKAAYSLFSVLAGFFVFYCFHMMTNKYFKWSIGRKQNAREKMDKKKREILERVKETEVFKVAKEILDKYEDSRQPSESDISMQAPRIALPLQPHASLDASLLEATRLRTPASEAPSVDASIENFQKLNDEEVDSSTVSRRITPLRPLCRPPRPFPKQRRSVADKVVDFLLGEGPSHRYALICAYCFGHNGMAREEEFDYFAYRCYLCGEFNPARKQRLRLPGRTYSERSLTNSSPLFRTQSESTGINTTGVEATNSADERVRSRPRSGSHQRPLTTEGLEEIEEQDSSMNNNQR